MLRAALPASRSIARMDFDNFVGWIRRCLLQGVLNIIIGKYVISVFLQIDSKAFQKTEGEKNQYEGRKTILLP
jgi:hypothetical protein